MRLYKYLALVLVSVLLLGGCGGQVPAASPSTTTPGTAASSTPSAQPTEATLEPGVLSPGQLDASRLNQAVKVRGKVVQVIENPGGQGGFYLKLSGGGGEVGVRIEAQTWAALSAAQQAQYREGQTATAEGTLVKSGADLVIVLGVIPAATSQPTRTPTTTPTSTPTEEPLKTTFTVKVPANTPAYSTIYMEWYYREGGYWSNIDNIFKMQKVNADTWKTEIALTPTGYGADGNYFYYRYSRDTWGYPTAEEFSPDAENACRQVAVKGSAGKSISDTVGKWRWFPKPGEPPLTVPPSSAQTATIVPRINGEKLLRGIGLQDFFNASYGLPLAAPTLQAIKADDANAIAFGAPVWTYRQIDPLPVIVASSFYPMAGLESQLAQYQAEGFHILMSVQFGTYAEDPSFYQGNPFDTEHSSAWWDAWYQEVEKAMLISADLAQKYHVEMLAPCGGLLTAWGKAPDAEARFSALIDKIRQHYSGRIGASQVLGLQPPDWQPASPVPGDIPAYEKYDFIYLGLVAALTTKENPTQEELNATARQLFQDKIKPLYDQYQKPVVLVPGYSSFKGVLQDVGKYSEAETLLWSPYNPNVVFSGQEQAMAYEAIMNAVAGAEYVIGIEPFGYHLEEFPQARAQDIRSKPAEQILAGWYQRFAAAGR